MTPMYEIWQSHQPEGNTWGNCWEGNERVLLPLAWAKSYAEELAEQSGLPTEVRNRNHQVKAKFGAN